MSKIGRASRNASLLRVETVSADKTISSAESGELYFLDGSTEGNITVTLPAAKAGAYLTFVLVAASNAATEIKVAAPSGQIRGTVEYQAAGTTAGDAQRRVKAAIAASDLVFADASVLGSRLELVCDGTNWLILRAESSAAWRTSFS